MVGDRVEIIERVNIEGSAGNYSAVFSGTEDPATYYVSTVEALRVPQAASAPQDSLSLPGEAEMLIIAHPDFLDGLEPLVAARRSEGLSVQVVNVEELYHRFSHGVFDPQAIRTFIGLAYRHQGTEYVLLVGGDTYDYFDYLDQGAISFVPTLYTRTDPIVHYAPVDPLYGDVDDDGVPEVSIGRWPVRTTMELEAVLDKTLRYADIDYPRTAVFSADAFDATSGYSFSAASEEMLSYLPADLAGAESLSRRAESGGCPSGADRRDQLRRGADQLLRSFGPRDLELRGALRHRRCGCSRERRPADRGHPVGLLEHVPRHAHLRYAGSPVAAQRRSWGRSGPGSRDPDRGGVGTTVGQPAVRPDGQRPDAAWARP